MRIPKLLVALLIFSLSSNGFAYEVTGAGNLSCAIITEVMTRMDTLTNLSDASLEDVSANAQVTGWVNGFITGINFSNQSTLGSDMAARQTGQWLRNYCELNPLDSLDKATRELVIELKNRQ